MSTAADVPEPMSTVLAEWNAFQQIGQFEDHWSRPGWTEHTESFHWFLTFEAADELHDLAERCQERLNGFTTLDPVPGPLLHLTLERAGFVDEISRDQAVEIADAFDERATDLQPFAVRIGPLAGSTGAVRFSVTPHEPIRHLRSVVMDAVADVRGPTSVDPSAPFIPHVSISYSNATVVADPIITEVARLRRFGSVLAPIDAVHLVQLRRQGRLYVWDPVRTIDL